MAQDGVQLSRETFSCPICKDLLKDPVALPCGHSYCMDCMKGHWDSEEEKKVYSCPLCSQTFTPRPVLLKNTMLDVLVEKLKKTGPEDVACDVCMGRKLKACNSCLGLLSSYSEQHLQPHHNGAAERDENICCRHNEEMKMFCRTDQQSICYLCLMEEHKDHDTVAAAAERAERQRELGESQQNIQQRIQDREKDVKMLQQQVEAINRSADEALEHNEKIFAQLIRLMEERRSDVRQQVRSQQEAEVSRAREMQEKLQQEITKLKTRAADLEELSNIEDHTKFLLDYASLSAESAETSTIDLHPLRTFEAVTAAVTDIRDKLQEVLTEKSTKTEAEVDASLPQPEPETRVDFLKYCRDITLDPNTTNIWVLLSDGDRKMTLLGERQPYPPHADRFLGCWQALSRESLLGRCYWEVEWKGRGVFIAVAYKDITRMGNESGFGYNDKSWALNCDGNRYHFWHNNEKVRVTGPRSALRVGVYLDHVAGSLSFYSVGETMTLLHRVETTFTQPLYAGLRFHYLSSGDTAELCKVR